MVSSKVAELFAILVVCYVINYGESSPRRPKKSVFEQIESINEAFEIVSPGSEKDIDFGDEQFVHSNENDAFRELYRTENEARAAMLTLNKRWVNGIVPYRLSAGYTSPQKSTIENAMKEIEDRSCIRFERYLNQPDYIEIVKRSGCSSYVGRVGGRQPVSLVDGCVHKAIIQHELLHALGMWHEQSRVDRNNFVKIHYENIKSGREHNFNIRTASDNQGVQYNPSSIMHYHKTAFSKNNLDTIQWKGNPSKELGGTELATSDMKQVNLLYACADVVKPITTLSTPRPVKTTKTPGGKSSSCSITSTSGVCADNHYMCAVFVRTAQKCTCQMVKELCPMTCGCCTPTQKCGNFVNLSPHCQSMNSCSDYIRRRCPKKCCELGQLN